MNIVRAIVRLSRLVAVIGLLGIVCLSVLTVADVIGREAFRSPLMGLSDILDMVVIFSAASCFPTAIADRNHVVVRVLGGLVSWRAREALDLFGHLVVLVVFSIITLEVFKYAAFLFENKQVTWLLGVKVWPVWALTSAMIAFCVPLQVIIVALQFRRLISSSELPEGHGELVR